MPFDTGSLVKDVLDFFKSKLPVEILIVVFIISGFVLLAPEKWIRAIRMNAWIEHYWPWLVVACAFSGLTLITSTVKYTLVPIVKKRRARNSISGYLHTLSSDEIAILLRYVDSGRKTVAFHPANGAVQNLVNAGVLYWTGNLVSRLRGWDCTVTPLAEPYLRRGAFQGLLDELTDQQLQARREQMNYRKGDVPSAD